MAKIIALSGVVGWDILAKDVRAELTAAKGEDVEFHGNSPGGFVFEGIEIFNLIRDYKGNTEFHIVGIAASMMTYIALAADKVLAKDNAAFMIHDALTCVCGNHRDMAKAQKWLDGISNVIAKVYVNKTGKSLSEIRALMEEDMFLFGDEILTEGFVDEIIPALDDGETDKAAAILTARTSVEMCVNRMRTSEAANDDFNRAVAYFDGMSALLDAPAAPKKPTTPAAVGDSATGANATKTTPASAGNNQEVKHMSLKTLLADPANSSAKVEYDAAMAIARTEGEKAAKDEMKAVIASISPKLTSEAYGPDVKEAGIKAITGEGHISTFETLVVIADRDIEKAKAKAALEESEGTEETPGSGGGGGADAAEAAAATAKKKADVLAQGGF